MFSRAKLAFHVKSACELRALYSWENNKPLLACRRRICSSNSSTGTDVPDSRGLWLGFPVDSWMIMTLSFVRLKKKLFLTVWWCNLIFHSNVNYQAGWLDHASHTSFHLTPPDATWRHTTSTNHRQPTLRNLRLGDVILIDTVNDFVFKFDQYARSISNVIAITSLTTSKVYLISEVRTQYCHMIRQKWSSLMNLSRIQNQSEARRVATCESKRNSAKFRRFLALRSPGNCAICLIVLYQEKRSEEGGINSSKNPSNHFTPREIQR